MILRPANSVLRALVCAAAALLLQATVLAAPAVRVTLQLDNNVLKVGDITTAHVMAEIVPEQKATTEQIVTWYLDFLNSAPSFIEIVPNSVIVPKADGGQNTSSKGTLTAGNLRAIFDTFFNTPDAGHDAPIELFSVRLRAIAVGASTFSVAAGTTAPALAEDFIVSSVTGEPVYGGLYNTATAQITSFNNTPPTINTIARQSVNEGTRVSVTAVGADIDAGQTLRYAFATAAPVGATVDAITGVFGWTPTEAQGPSIVTIRIKVTDNGTPPMSATNQFDIGVNEVNTAPTLQVPAAITVSELQAIAATCIASDVDVLQGRTPNTNRLTFSLVNPPAGATINPSTGAFAWSTTEAHGPGSHTIRVIVTDDGVPPMAATNTFGITITEQNLPPTIAAPPAQTLAEGATLNVAFIANDVDLPANQLTFGIVNAPAGVVLDSNTGLITWTPTEAQGPGVYTIRVRVSDNATVPLFATNSVQVTVTEVNAAPVLTALQDRTVNELTPISFSAVAQDSDLPLQTLTFSLDSPPAGASINPTSGAFAWTPTEAQGPGRYAVVVRITDNGTPARSDTKSFDVIVNEVNAPPSLVTPAGQATQTIPELVGKTIQFTATDSDAPAQLISFSLQNAPSGAVIDAATGLFSWTPSEDQGPGPGVYAIRVVATDNGIPPQSATNTVNLTVTEANTAPTLAGIDNQVIDELTQLRIVATARDSDLPAQTLTYSLTAAPPGAVIDPATGILTWTPTEAQGPGQFTITVRVAESGATGLFATRTFSVTVNEVNVAPAFAAQTVRTVPEMAAINATIAATDADANTITYALLSGPAGMTINPTTGALTWTPTEAQGPATYQVHVSATDNGLPELSTTTTVTFNVTEVNRAPTIPALVNQTIAELAPLNATFTGSDPDLPANSLTFALVSGPAGATVNVTSGAVAWTPTEAQGPGTFQIRVAVSDNQNPALRNTNTLNVTVTEVNTKPTLAAIPDLSIMAGTPIGVTAVATDTDLPAQTITYSLDAAPAGATINPTSGALAWTPAAGFGGQQFSFTVRATESGTAALFDTKTFRVSVTARPNSAPVIASPSGLTATVGTLFTHASLALDADTPANTLTYSFVQAPTGATIAPTTGVITWTPTSAQIGSQSFRVKVLDNGTPPMSGTNTFTVNVTQGAVNNEPAVIRIVSVLTGGVTLRVEGIPNASYDIEYSTDIINWSRVTTLSLGAQTFGIHLDAAHGFGQQKGFYRAKNSP